MHLPASPSKIVCVGRNYADHAKELGNDVPVEPLLFFKPPSALIPHGAPIVLPQGFGRIDYEGELAVVIGKTCKDVPEEQAWDVIAGYTILNDVTARELQKKDGQWTRAKGFDTFAPCGPTFVSGLDVRDVAIETRLNGQVVQSGRTSQLIFPIPRLIAYITQCMTLVPGDIVSTGTPSGVGPLKAGDVVEVTVEGIGTLSNPVVEKS